MEIVTTNLNIFLVKKIHLSKIDGRINIRITSVTIHPTSGEIVDVQTDVCCIEANLKSLGAEKVEMTYDEDILPILTLITENEQ